MHRLSSYAGAVREALRLEMTKDWRDGEAGKTETSGKFRPLKKGRYFGAGDAMRAMI